MSKKRLLSSLRWLRSLADVGPRRHQELSQGWAEVVCGRRGWEDLYRRRWQYDKKVRSTHGVNCTGSCSWDVFVKDGIIVWELQNTDYPGCGPDFPDHEPRGCPRGSSFSWYTYSPVRVKHPYIRSTLLEIWKEAREYESDPVKAWAAIVEDPFKKKKYQQSRGKGGFVRVSTSEAIELIAASLVYTVKKFGPDRIFGFSPIPAMSMVGYASGSRFLSLIGASMASFYDWYCDLPPSSPQVWGEQTDVPESADWFESTYMIVWGTNLPMTRTPDAHFFSEARYRGAKVVAVSPDYTEYVKFSDTWLPAKAGTDSAMAMAMTFVVIKEFYLDHPSDYFTTYAKSFTDLPFAVRLKPDLDEYVSDRFLRASDLGLPTKKPEWKTVYFDTNSRSFVAPNGTMGSRWDEEGRWNLKLEDSITGSEVNPALSFADDNDRWVSVKFPFFGLEGSKIRTGTAPVKRIFVQGEEILVTTVFDLMVANLGIEREPLVDNTRAYDDPNPYTPAWQEGITGVPANDVIAVAREFAENAEKTHGKSMILLGSGTNHWFHSDMTYRTILNLTSLCGCQGVNGGGWAHYTGQEKVRPLVGWSTIAFGLDWIRPPRQINGTSFFYFATGQWRYDTLDARSLASPLAPSDLPEHPADYNVISTRMGWLPSYPQFDQNPLDLCIQATSEGCVTDEEIISNIVGKLKDGRLSFAAEDPDNPVNFPRLLFIWRSNLLGSSGKGHEYFLKNLLGTHSSILGHESKLRPREIKWRDQAPEGKLDLLVSLDFRMSTSDLYSDVVLPAASWYEIHDLSTTDLHPFIHPFNPAIDPPWDTKSDWDHFSAIAAKFSELSGSHLGVRKDIVATPLLHDSPGEIAQSRVLDWKKGEAEPIPGKTMPNLQILTRDFPNAHKMMNALGPMLVDGTIGAKGVTWNPSQEYTRLRSILGTVKDPGLTFGMPELKYSKQVAEAILTLSPETNGSVAVKSWTELEKRTGLKLAHLSAGREEEKLTFSDLTVQPRKIMTSPTWSGVESENRRYSAFVINYEERVPFRTLTGRAHFYLDHEWMLAFGEGLPIFRPPLNMDALGSVRLDQRASKTIVLNYISPHSKWSIHSTYAETLIMLTLFRGGATIWMNNEDATSVDIKDNDWVECFNVNGLTVARAVVSHRIPVGKAFMYHAQERLIVPDSEISGQTSGGHNSVTRIVMKPTLMIGAYAQLSYSFNYYCPTGSERDVIVAVRKAEGVKWHED
ncbi:MAG: nitrate reductase subunit alpha [Desulfomonilaceae bacterium]|jgi:nitrate reductase alpha subunit